MITDHIANTPTPSDEVMEEFHKGFSELAERTGVKAAYFVSGSDPEDDEELQILTGGENYQLQFLRMMLDYAGHRLD